MNCPSKGRFHNLSSLASRSSIPTSARLRHGSGSGPDDFRMCGKRGRSSLCSTERTSDVQKPTPRSCGARSPTSIRKRDLSSSRVPIDQLTTARAKRSRRQGVRRRDPQVGGRGVPSRVARGVPVPGPSLARATPCSATSSDRPEPPGDRARRTGRDVARPGGLRDVLERLAKAAEKSGLSQPDRPIADRAGAERSHGKPSARCSHRIAGRYDLMTASLGWRRHRVAQGGPPQSSTAHPDGPFLDLCAGTARARGAARKDASHTAHPSRSTFRKGCSRRARAGIAPRTETVVADATSTPLPDQTFAGARGGTRLEAPRSARRVRAPGGAPRGSESVAHARARRKFDRGKGRLVASRDHRSPFAGAMPRARPFSSIPSEKSTATMAVCDASFRAARRARACRRTDFEERPIGCAVELCAAAFAPRGSTPPEEDAVHEV